MAKQEKVFAFDVGKASLGICCREGNHILGLQSLLIPAEYGATADFRSRRRAYRTRQAHKKREEWLCRVWIEAGLTPLNHDDKRLKSEFPKRGEEKIYNSALLRIALLQERPLEEWQIFKALWAAIQRRGYDKDCDWNFRNEEEALSEDSKENLESVGKYQEALYYHMNSQAEYLFPCYLEATLMGLWHWEQPDKLNIRIDSNATKVRQKGMVTPRQLVEKEIRQLFENAQRQLPALAKVNVNEFLYGPSGKAYASLSPEFAQYRGSEWDTQGVLSQKVPRFDNRILNKCQMLPKRNVCKANDPLSLQFNLLMKLKNIRFTDENGEVGRFLSSEELKTVYTLCQENLSEKKTQEITFGNLVKFIEKTVKTRVMDINLAKGEKIKLNATGRSRFCRPALTIMNKILLEGTNPSDFDVMPHVQQGNNNAITQEELESLISRLGQTWEGFHIGDKRYIDLESTPDDKEKSILKLIGSVNNPVVRHRLTFFWNELKKMDHQYGTPDKVILEFARGGEGLDGQKTANDWERAIKESEKRNDRIREQLEEQGLKSHKWNIKRFKLAEEQQWHCPYTGERLHAGNLEYYQVDHIVPVSSDIATDAFYNKVLCTSQANQDKGNRTPYEWLSATDEWQDFLARVTDKNSSYSKKKKELLIRNDARDLVDSYNGLAETAYIARLAQQIVALEFGWGLQTKGDNRRIFVNDGKMTAKIRKIYSLNELLLTGEEQSKLSDAKDASQQRTIWKKNRENHKHHALDAYCISYSQDLKISRVDEQGRIHWHVPGLEESKAQLERKLIDLFPKPVRRNTKELYPLETIYGYRKRIENGKEVHYLTVRKNLFELLGKDRKKIRDIFDLEIRQDLEKRSEEIKDNKDWQNFLVAYKHPKRNGRVKAVLIIESRSDNPPQVDKAGRMIFGEFKDFGNLDTKEGRKGITRHQFKHSKANKGQIIYHSGKGWKVQQVYVHEKTDNIKQSLLDSGYKLYRDGLLFYPGCQIFIPFAFKAGKKELPGGLYKSRTVRADGIVLLENNNGEEFHTNIKYLVEAGVELAEYHDKTVKVLSTSSE